MAAILTENFSVLNTENFMTSISTSTDETNLYLTLGRGYHSGSNSGDTNTPKDDIDKWETDSLQGSCTESEPPIPQDTEEYKEDFRNHITFLKQLQLSDFTMMVPRYNWNTGTIYYPVNPKDKQGKRSKNHYVLSQDTQNNTLEVWVCEGNGQSEVDHKGSENLGTAATIDPSSQQWTGGNAASMQPLLRNWPIEARTLNPKTGLYMPYNFGDGIIWRFLYDISPLFQTSGKVTTNWMPVPFNKFGKTSDSSNLTDNQINYGDVNANRTLGAHRILVSCELSEEENLPYDTIYRQVGILADPLTHNNSEDVYAEQSRVNTTSCTPSDIDLTSGELIYMENRSPVQRSEGQIETLQLLLVF